MEDLKVSHAEEIAKVQGLLEDKVNVLQDQIAALTKERQDEIANLTAQFSSSKAESESKIAKLSALLDAAQESRTEVQKELVAAKKQLEDNDIRAGTELKQSVDDLGSGWKSYAEDIALKFAEYAEVTVKLEKLTETSTLKEQEHSKAMNEVCLKLQIAQTEASTLREEFVTVKALMAEKDDAHKQR